VSFEHAQTKMGDRSLALNHKACLSQLRLHPMWMVIIVEFGKFVWG
jgi:hypothetical protein